MIAELSFAVCLAFNGHCLSRKHALMQWAYRFLFCAITYVLLWKTVQQTILQFPEVYVWWRFSIQSSKQKQVSYRTEAIEKWRYWSSCSDELACKFIEKSKWTHKQSSTDQCCDLFRLWFSRLWFSAVSASVSGASAHERRDAAVV